MLPAHQAFLADFDYILKNLKVQFIPGVEEYAYTLSYYFNLELYLYDTRYVSRHADGGMFSSVGYNYTNMWNLIHCLYKGTPT